MGIAQGRRNLPPFFTERFLLNRRRHDVEAQPCCLPVPGRVAAGPGAGGLWSVGFASGGPAATAGAALAVGGSLLRPPARRSRRDHRCLEPPRVPVGRPPMDRDRVPLTAASGFPLAAVWRAWPTYTGATTPTMARPSPRRAPPAVLRPRCHWAREPLDVEYHDREWGVPVRDDRTLFEFLLLEGAQAGLSWSTILRK